jgi:hypothetical protein
MVGMNHLLFKCFPFNWPMMTNIFLTSFDHACCLHFLIMVVVYLFFFHLAYDDKNVCYNMVSCTELMNLNL